MHDPQTVAHEIKYPWRERKSKLWPKGYRGTFITIWHVDPERPTEGHRADDSCGWFDRRPREYADAIAWLLRDTTFVHEVNLILARKVETPAPFYEGISEEQLSWARLTSADALALCLMVARQLELRRWWNGQNGDGGAHASWWRKTFTRQRRVDDLAIDLALSPGDNLASVEAAETVLRLMAGALARKFKPWWRHPRWHVHHWKFQVHPWQQFKRWAFARCSDCRKGFKWGESVWGYGDERTFHFGCGEHGGPSVARGTEP